MIKRRIAIPAAFLPSLDAAIDGVMKDIAAGTIPEWGQDDVPGNLYIVVTIERADFPAVKLQGAA